MIRHLPADVRACIRTGVALTSLAQAVEELVLNSIDAEANSIAIRVDLSCFKLQVVDNGTGITLDQFQLIGERYSTSKCHSVQDLDNLKYFGYRGEALASLRSAASFLEIISRSRSSVITYSKCFQKGNKLEVVQASQLRPSAGTTVTAHDLFYNLPVRRKLINPALEMEKIRYRVAGIALVWPHISFSLRDDTMGHVLLQTHKCSGMVAAFSYIFTPARARGLMEVSAAYDEFTISGLVSKESYSRMDLQFVYINKRLVLKSSIHRQINKILGRSLILRRKGFTSEMLEKAAWNTSGSPQKQQERFPVFSVNIECPYSAYDITFDPSKTLVEFHNWPKLIHLLQDMLYGFLRRENLISSVAPATCSSSPILNNMDNDDDDILHDDEDSTPGYEGSSMIQQENQVSTTGASLKEGSFKSLFEVSKNIPFQKDKLGTEHLNTEVADSSQRDTDEDISQKAASKTKMSDSLSCSLYKLSKPDNCCLPGKTLMNNLTLPDINSDFKTHASDKSIAPGTLTRLLSSESLRFGNIHNQQDDSEEVILEKQMTPKRKKEITLRNSIPYSSTLSSLRKIKENSFNRNPQKIITNTLQQLKNFTQEVVNQSDFYKTPAACAVYQDSPSPHKQRRQESQRDVTSTCITNFLDLTTELSNIQKNKFIEKNSDIEKSLNNSNFKDDNHHNTASNIVNNMEPSCSVIFRSAKQDKSLGQIDREFPSAKQDKSFRPNDSNDKEFHLKRASNHSLSHSSKLAKLMRGETIIDSDQGVLKGVTSCSRHKELLHAFKFQKSRKTKHLRALERTEGIQNCSGTSNMDCVNKYCKETNGSHEELQCMNTAKGLNSFMDETKDKMSGSGEFSWKKAADNSHNCCDYCSCCQKHPHQPNVPFSSYRNTEDVEKSIEDDVTDIPRISVILTLPMENNAMKHSNPNVCKSKPNLTDQNVLSNQYTLRQILEENVSSDRVHNFEEMNSEVTSIAASLCSKVDGIVEEDTEVSTDSFYTVLTDRNLKYVRPSLVNGCLSLLGHPEDNTSCKNMETLSQISQGFDTASTEQLDKVANTSTCTASCDPLLVTAERLQTGYESCGFTPKSYVNSSTDDSCGFTPNRDLPSLADTESSDCSNTVRNENFCSADRNKYIPLSDSDPENNSFHKFVSGATLLHDLSGSQEIFQENEHSGEEGLSDQGNVMGDINKADETLHCHSHSGESTLTENCQQKQVESSYELSQVEDFTVATDHGSKTDRSLLAETESEVSSQKQVARLTDHWSLPDQDTSIRYQGTSQNLATAAHIGQRAEKCFKDSERGTDLMKPQFSLTKLWDLNRDDEVIQINACQGQSETVEKDTNNVKSYQSVTAEQETNNVKSHQSGTAEQETNNVKSHQPWTAELEANNMNTHQSGTIELAELKTNNLQSHVSEKAELKAKYIKSCQSRTAELEAKNERSSQAVRSESEANDVKTVESRRSEVDTDDVRCLQQINLEVEIDVRKTQSARYKIEVDDVRIMQLVSAEVKADVVRTVLSEVNTDNRRGLSLRTPEVSADNFENFPLLRSEIATSSHTDFFCNTDETEFNLKADMCNSQDTVADGNVDAISMITLEHKDLFSKGGQIYEDIQTDTMLTEEDRDVLMSEDHMVRSSVISQDAENHIPDMNGNKFHLKDEKINISKSPPVSEPDSNEKLKQKNEKTGKRNEAIHASGVTNQSRPCQLVNLGCNFISNSVALIRPSKPTSESDQNTECSQLAQTVHISTDLDKFCLLNQALSPPSQENCNALVIDAGLRVSLEPLTESNNLNRMEQSQELKDVVQEYREGVNSASWREVTDPETGKRTYVNNKSGHTASEEQWLLISSQVQQKMLAEPCRSPDKSRDPPGLNTLSTSQQLAMQTLVADHLVQDGVEGAIKWRKGGPPVYTWDTEADVSTLLAKWSNPVFLNYKQPGVLADMGPRAGPARSCFHSLSSLDFTKEMLTSMEVIGQLDNKFVACLIKNVNCAAKMSPVTNTRTSSFLVLFDQHAVHERIRLEHLTKCAYEMENGERTDRVKRLEVDTVKSLVIDQDDLRIMKAFSKDFSRIGIDFTVEPCSRDTVHIRTFPQCLLDKDVSEGKKTSVPSETAERMIKEHIELLKSTNGAVGRLPMTIHRALCSQACHGAVKFGDQLSLEECKDLLSALSLCSLPFQCAHGRPSVAPLVNLDALEKELLTERRAPQLWKISQHLNHQ